MGTDLISEGTDLSLDKTGTDKTGTDLDFKQGHT